VWLIIPLVYFLGWWQTGSLRQAFNGTIAWIVAFSICALALLAMDVGGFSGLTATPDSPAAGIAILGGFIGMWVSNYFWRRRGGDPPRKAGKWERALRAIVGKDEKKKKKKRPAMPPQQPQQHMPQPPPQQQPVAAAPVDAQYRPAPNSAPSQPAQQQQQTFDPQMQEQQSPPPQHQHMATPQFQQSPAGGPPQGQYPVQQAAPPPPKKKKPRRNSPTADKYAKATGRALGAMFRGSEKKKSKKSPSR
jgi:hypothetical protein